jgi:tetratricopeptide (TPR) repeat protein
MTLTERLEQLRANGDYVELLHLLNEEGKRRPLMPRELVLKGQILQITGEEPNEEILREAEECFRAAIILDPAYVPALIELGWYFDAVLDDEPAAVEFFQSAFEHSRRNCIDALVGLARLASAKSPADGVQLMEKYAVLDPERVEAEKLRL